MKSRSGRAPQGQQSDIARGRRAMPGFVVGLCLAGVALGDERPPDLDAFCGRWMMNPDSSLNGDSDVGCGGKSPQPPWERHRVELDPHPIIPDDIGESPDDPRNEPDSRHYWGYSSRRNWTFDDWTWLAEAEVDYPVGTAHASNFLNVEVGAGAPRDVSSLYEREDMWEWVPCYDFVPCPPRMRQVRIRPSGVLHLFTEANVGRQVNDYAMATASAESLLNATAGTVLAVHIPTLQITATAHMKRTTDLSAVAVRLSASGEVNASGGGPIGGGGSRADVRIEGETNRNSENGGTDTGVGIAESTATVTLQPWVGLSADTVTAVFRNAVRTTTRCNSGDDRGPDNTSQGHVRAHAEFVLNVDAE